MHFADQSLHGLMAPDFKSALKGTQLSGQVTFGVSGLKGTEELAACLIRICL